MCDARIRPFPDNTELECGITTHGHLKHEAILKDYAYPGSSTVIGWLEDDRRTFHGTWPGPCVTTTGCVLPNTHRGRCAT